MTIISIATHRAEATVAVEIVTTPAAIERGLMHRRHLPWDRGMLFVMGGDAPWSFHMRNTLIPLDIIFIGSDWTIAGIVHHAAPLSTELRRIDWPSSYVLEVNGGWVVHHQVIDGAPVRLDCR